MICVINFDYFFFKFRPLKNVVQYLSCQKYIYNVQVRTVYEWYLLHCMSDWARNLASFIYYTEPLNRYIIVLSEAEIVICTMEYIM